MGAAVLVLLATACTSTTIDDPSPSTTVPAEGSPAPSFDELTILRGDVVAPDHDLVGPLEGLLRVEEGCLVASEPALPVVFPIEARFIPPHTVWTVHADVVIGEQIENIVLRAGDSGQRGLRGWVMQAAHLQPGIENVIDGIEACPPERYDEYLVVTNLSDAE
ncbi:MAG: hypothetical protein ACQEWM_08480 [Actinomycetota bacterium]